MNLRSEKKYNRSLQGGELQEFSFCFFSKPSWLASHILSKLDHTFPPSKYALSVRRFEAASLTWLSGDVNSLGGKDEVLMITHERAAFRWYFHCSWKQRWKPMHTKWPSNSYACLNRGIRMNKDWTSFCKLLINLQADMTPGTM